MNIIKSLDRISWVAAITVPMSFSIFVGDSIQSRILMAIMFFAVALVCLLVTSRVLKRLVTWIV